MATTYEIYADEAWTHGGEPPNRYWRIYGGIFGVQSNLDRLDTRLRSVIAAYGVRGEVKWGKLNAINYDCYVHLANLIFDEIEEGNVKYRQMFLDRSYVWVPKRGDPEETELTIQFKLYYQFLKHAFGLQYVPRDPNDDQIDLYVRLDSHTSQRHTDQLRSFAGAFPRILNRRDFSVRVTFHNSSKVPRLQICDLLMGAAGSYGNRMHKKRRAGQRGMTQKQQLRLNFCKHIYQRLRQIDAAERGSKAFNWFETTGLDGTVENLFHHKVRIWKFIPKRHVRDKGWQNDHLDKQGYYQGPDIVPAP